jgi:hypothetical protein
MGGIEMLTASWIDSSDSCDSCDITTPAAPTQVVEVDNWLERAGDPARPFTPSLCEYVPRHRAEAASTS